MLEGGCFKHALVRSFEGSLFSKINNVEEQIKSKKKVKLFDEWAEDFIDFCVTVNWAWKGYLNSNERFLGRSGIVN